MGTNYEVIFRNGQETETHIITYYDTNDYNEIKDYAETYANDEASNFLTERGFKVDTISKLVDNINEIM